MDDLISRQEAIKAVSEYGCVWMEYSRSMTKDEIAQRALNSAKATMIRIVKELPSAQPETAKRIVGKSRGGMTLWYQCDMCNEPVDAQDNYCRGCGRRLIDERSNRQTGGD